MPISCLRLFTVYGPYGRPDMAYFKLTKRILSGKKIDIYNKIGFAYGYVSETAFIETPKSSIIISIAMKVNENQIFNDNNYEYEEIAIPFFAEFGREIIDIINSK